jgi:hypothetical protein
MWLKWHVAEVADVAELRHIRPSRGCILARPFRCCVVIVNGESSGRNRTSPRKRSNQIGVENFLKLLHTFCNFLLDIRQSIPDRPVCIRKLLIVRAKPKNIENMRGAGGAESDKGGRPLEGMQLHVVKGAFANKHEHVETDT